MNWSEFWQMGGYGFYVWTSWGLTMVVMLLLVISAKLRRRKLIKQLHNNAQRAAVKQEPNS